MTEIGFALRDLIGVMRKGVVHAAAVDVEVFAVVLFADAGALDVPAGIAQAPRRFPFQLLILKFGFGEPEHKVGFVALVLVLLHAVAHADSQILLVHVAEHVVGAQLGGVKVDVAAGKIGVALFEQNRDHVDKLVDTVGSRLHHVGAFDVELFAVGKECVGVELRDLHHGLVLALGALEHFVLAGVGVGGEVSHVGDVHDAVDVVARKAEIFFEHILHDVGAQVADMRVVIHGGAAGVHVHLARCVRNKLLLGLSERIIQNHRLAPFDYFSEMN